MNDAENGNNKKRPPTMTMLFKTKDNRGALQVGRQSAIAHQRFGRAVAGARAQAVFKDCEKQRELTIALRDLAKARYERAKRDRELCPSAESKHEPTPM